MGGYYALVVPRRLRENLKCRPLSGASESIGLLTQAYPVESICDEAIRFFEQRYLGGILFAGLQDRRNTSRDRPVFFR